MGTRVITLLLCLVLRLYSRPPPAQIRHTPRPPQTDHPIRRHSHVSHERGHTSHLQQSAIHSRPDAPGLHYCQIPGTDPKHRFTSVPSPGQRSYSCSAYSTTHEFLANPFYSVSGLTYGLHGPQVKTRAR